FTDSPKATLTWASYLGHDSPHTPFHADAHYEQFFKRNKKEFDNSFVFFMGDHGLRFGWYSRDSVGRRDVDNPMLLVSVPQYLRNGSDLMKNLIHNSDQLLSHFDTHATFIDIIETFSGKLSTNYSDTVGLKGSSFLRPLPDGQRNCKTLPIPPQYCLCEITRARQKITVEHSAIGQAVSTFLNSRLAENQLSDLCAKLELEKLTELNLIEGAEDLYEVTVKLRPDGGIFKTFVQRTRGEYFVIVPDVNRLNAYGHNGDCITINELRPFCFCKSNNQHSSTPRPITAFNSSSVIPSTITVSSPPSTVTPSISTLAPTPSFVKSSPTTVSSSTRTVSSYTNTVSTSSSIVMPSTSAVRPFPSSDTSSFVISQP
ncbi:hypothetical protein PENTCL1PPCAC_3423, partial [Pristionchus entomophagus]